MMETRGDIVGEGDQLIITVFGQPDLSADVVVGSMGIITLPLVGAMEVKGKSTMDVAIQFANKLEQGQYLINPKVAVRIGQQISRNFSVFGEVVRPGRFPMQGQLNVLDALSLAGGLTTRADKSVKLLRKNAGADQDAAEVDTMQIEFESHKNNEKLMQKILPNDVLVVGQQKTFYVYGEVRRPGSYPMEEAMNVMRVLAVGGGVSERGSSSRIVIHRKDKHGELIEMPANIKDVVLPGDVVVVNERIF
ncbi:SLBB domain-containing protein [Undibacterium rugosum]|uniref:SLBB domain-containing protein n=1 Tax=Undibacterium rugosum TaxID=2762291 RepID=A0A923I4I7_9BURK|nr:SLBB domain-containing protein [Undibacterium rugosum]MBC3935366.1 SLBB domain-containing protein [Undibacterium rugosum]MBR7778859.1 SLBB domain-containing protein [Undibacterium rugosum]